MQAFFNDGQTSKNRDCNLTFYEEEIEVRYYDDEQTLRQSIWRISDIHPLDVRTSSKSIRHGEFPSEIIDFTSQEDLDRVINHYPDALFHQSLYNKFSSFGWKGILVAFVSIVGFCCLFLIYGAPILADNFAKIVPMKYEEYVGENVRDNFLLYQEIDSSRSEVIQKFYDQLNYESEYNVKVIVVESKLVNAFAVPGGNIVVFSGILDLISTKEELAGLLAHEVSHVNGRHSLRQISRALSTYLLISILTSDFGGFSSVIIENTDLISTLSFTRELEKEADLEGLNLMMHSHIDPIGMVDLFKKFESSQDSMEQIVEDYFHDDSLHSENNIDSSDEISELLNKATDLMSTHPSPKNRVGYLTQKIEQSSNKIINSNDSLQSIFIRLKSK